MPQVFGFRPLHALVGHKETRCLLCSHSPSARPHAMPSEPPLNRLEPFATQYPGRCSDLPVLHQTHLEGRSTCPVRIRPVVLLQSPVSCASPSPRRLVASLKPILSRSSMLDIPNSLKSFGFRRSQVLFLPGFKSTPLREPMGPCHLRLLGRPGLNESLMILRIPGDGYLPAILMRPHAAALTSPADAMEVMPLHRCQQSALCPAFGCSAWPRTQKLLRPSRPFLRMHVAL